MDYKEQTMTANSINVIAALWLIIAPFVLGFGGTASASNSIILGIIFGVLVLIKIFSPMSSRWINWTYMILAVWLIISPFILGYTGVTEAWNAIVLGIIIGTSSAWASSTASHSI